MRIALLVNDSLFAYEVAQPIIRNWAPYISGVVLSTATTRSSARLGKVVRRVCWRYLVYRSAVELLTRVQGRSVRALARAAGVPVWTSRDLRAETPPPADIAIAINLDQILRADTLKEYPLGVLNFHASRLPADRGISPALWAFARGDESIGLTIYEMDEGLDTGPIYCQDEVPVRFGETAFEMYRRVCKIAGERLVDTLQAVARGVQPTPQEHAVRQPALSWPDATFSRMLKKSRRRLMIPRLLPTMILPTLTSVDE